jgi:hypothetical protein
LVASSQTLLERALNVEKQIDVLGTLDKQREEVVALQDRREKLEEAVGDIEKNVTRTRLLRSGGLPLTIDATALRRLNERIAETATAFREKPEAQTLAANQRWTQLVAAVQREGEKLKIANNAAWDKFAREECSAEAPRSLEQKLPPSAENTQALNRYTARYAELSTQLRTGAAAPEDIAKIRATVATLQTEVTAMHFDYPSDITDFLRAAMAPSGVPLSGVTPQLLEWLREHDMLESYTVRSRS